MSRTARAWAELMPRLSYTRYVARGGDVGAGFTDAIARQAPEGLVGIQKWPKRFRGCERF